MTQNFLLLAALITIADVAAGGERVDFRSYWCEGTQQRGGGAQMIPYGGETRIGVIDFSDGGGRTVMLACTVNPPPKLQVNCRALRGKDETPEPMAAITLVFGTPKSIPVVGDGGQHLTLTIVAYAMGAGPDFGPYQCPFSVATQKQISDAVPDIVQTIQIAGVDADAGDPEIWMMSTGALNLHFQSFPPTQVSSEDEAKPYETFAEQLEVYLGVPVSWEDRELFHIARPKRETIDRIKKFVQSFPAIPVDGRKE